MAVLTVHGTSDEIVPFSDAICIGSILPNHETFPVESCTHMFYGKYDLVVSKIVSWMWSQRIRLKPFLNAYAIKWPCDNSNSLSPSNHKLGYITDDYHKVEYGKIYVYTQPNIPRDSMYIDDEFSSECGYPQNEFKLLDWKPHSRNDCIAFSVGRLMGLTSLIDKPLGVFSHTPSEVDYRDLVIAISLAILRVPLDVVSKALAVLCCLKNSGAVMPATDICDIPRLGHGIEDEVMFVSFETFIFRFLYETLAEYKSFENFIAKEGHVSPKCVSKFRNCMVTKIPEPRGESVE